MLKPLLFNIASKLANALPKISSAKQSNTLHCICFSMFSKPVYEEDIIRNQSIRQQ